jgi:hypothetical protein
MLGDFTAKELNDIFKPTFGNENINETNNDGGVRVVNLATYKSLALRNTMLPCCNIHKFTWTSGDGKAQSNGACSDGKRLWNVRDIQLFKEAHCNSDNWRVLTGGRERLAVNKLGSHGFHIERFILKMLNVIQGKEKYRVDV